MFKKYKKFIVIGVVVAILAAILLFPRSQKQTAEFSQVKRGEIKQVISASGTLTGKNVAYMRFKASGKLIYLNVKPGDKVYRGELIAKLDDTNQSIALQQALNTLRDREATLDNVYDQLKGHDSNETFLQKAQRTTAEVAKDNAYDAVRASQHAFEDVEVFAPFSGVVVDQGQIEVGQNVSPSDLVAQIVDFPNYEFSADVDEADIEKISEGEAVEVTLNAYPDKVFKGKVDEIIPSTKTSSSGATTVNVKIRLTKASLAAIYGLGGQADIIIAKKENVLTIPQEALTSDNEVLVRRDGRFERVRVETGIKSDTDIEIVSGIKEGEEVITNPQTLPLTSRNRNPFIPILRFGR